MKLYELINFEPKKSNKTYPGYRSRLRNIGADELGSGSFGATFDTKSEKRQGQVTKVGRAGNIQDRSKIVKKVEDDGYLAYLKAVFDSGSDNPYFPRIDDLTVRADKDTGALTYRANLQKLVPFTSDKIYGNDDLMESLYDDMFTEHTHFYKDFGAAAGIKFNIDAMASSNNYTKIKDPEMKEALLFIEKVRQSGNFTSDLHSGNMMWRITGTRPQLVFSDPLS